MVVVGPGSRPGAVDAWEEANGGAEDGGAEDGGEDVEDDEANEACGAVGSAWSSCASCSNGCGGGVGEGSSFVIIIVSVVLTLSPV